eukprot:CAMPEP_0182441574 /NCGR_PEP_ID=MMETSP1172-20130603/540_1 /TAXON_ID=708627 /ORGANISM="Timspurckia oligopyrenoides, Strain CCMP3278" /LENGTH=831 /DNA_ID=CAMNT_0024635935 /DNA_START=23 /DNA_END=2518 /DNA_ORIENTATION=+
MGKGMMGNSGSKGEGSGGGGSGNAGSKQKKKPFGFIRTLTTHKSSTNTNNTTTQNNSQPTSVQPPVSNTSDQHNNAQQVTATTTSPSHNNSSSVSAQNQPDPKSSASSANDAVTPHTPKQLGLKNIDFINVHRKNQSGIIELLQGSVEGLSPSDETDLLIVYLRERGAHKANRDSALAALNRGGMSLAQLEKESKPQPSYRRHYHCWLSRQLPKPRPAGFEYKRLLVYEDPGEELTRDDNIVLDIMKCLTTVIGGDVQIGSVLLPLSGALLSPSLRKHFVKAATEVCFAWMSMGLPLRKVRILLPETDIEKDITVFQGVKEKLLMKGADMLGNLSTKYDVFFSYAKEDQEAAHEMMNYLQGKNPSVRIYDAEPRDISLRQRGVVHAPVMEAINQSRVFLSLLSDDYFHSVECTEAFSLAYCRDFDSQGNFIIPLFWRSCDLTPLARRLVATEGVDCRECSFDAAKVLLEEILTALATQPESVSRIEDEAGNSLHSATRVDEDKGKINIAEKLMMMKSENEVQNFEQIAVNEAEPEETVSQIFFDKPWRDQWAVDFRSIVFGPRIGAGGFGEVYKAKWKAEMVAVKMLTKNEEDDQQAQVAEFMVEMKLMSKLKHPNIVSFLGACVHQPNLAIVLEFMPGGSLYRAIHRRRRNHLGPFPLLKTLWIAYGVSKGMEYLHCQYPVIIHRDLKSPNILLGSNVHEVKLTDFGLSRLRVATYVNTGPGGTPEWMAPELLRQDPFDEMSDVFSFGVILWELIVCEKPWRDDHPMQIVFKVGSRGEKLQIPAGVQCSTELKTMITSCFQEQPSKRPRFAELTKQLEAMVQSVEAARKK